MKAIPPKVRAEVAERSEGRCERCLSRRAVHMHHRRTRSHGGSHAAENLAHLCSVCHDYVHANPAESYRDGWLIRGVA